MGATGSVFEIEIKYHSEISVVSNASIVYCSSRSIVIRAVGLELGTPVLHKQSHNGEFNLLPGTSDGLIAKYCLCEPTCLVIYSVGTNFLLLLLCETVDKLLADLNITINNAADIHKLLLA